MKYPNYLGHNRDGLYRRKVVKVQSTMNRDGTTATKPILTVEESGTYFLIPAANTALVWTLPKISSKQLGVEYTFHVLSSQASSAGSFKLNCALDSSAKIKMPFSSVIDEHSSIIPATTLATGLTVTAVSSVVWMGQGITANSYSDTSVATSFGGWTTG